MKDNSKTVLIVMALVAVITVGTLLIVKIGDINKIGASVSVFPNYNEEYTLGAEYYSSGKVKSHYLMTKKNNKKVTNYTGWYDGVYVKNGKVVTGLKKIGGDWYYIYYNKDNDDKNTNVWGYKYLLFGWIEEPNVGGNNKSKFHYGYFKEGKYTKYYLKNGDYNINGITYEFDSSGYCVSPNCSKISSKNLITVPAQTNTESTADSIGRCYYAGGYPISGLNKYNNVWQYQTWNKSTGKCMVYPYKWHCNKKKKAKWYGYSSKYYLKNGSYNINGTTYKFDKNGYCTGSNCKNNTCK